MKTTGFIALAIALFMAIYFIIPYPRNFLKEYPRSIKILDRSGSLLFEFQGTGSRPQAGFSENLEFSEIPDNFLQLLIFAEDKNFYSHIGVDPRAVLRAAANDIGRLAITSGGSTISQQLVKIKYGVLKNNLLTKFLELFRAVKLELHFSKKEILLAYINNIYLGNKIYGLKKAAEVYFHKKPPDLSLIETASLCVMLQSPSRLNILTKTSVVESKARVLLKKAFNMGAINGFEYSLSIEKKLRVYPFEMDFYAPHFCFWVLDEAEKLVKTRGDISEIRTTLDLDLYKKCLEILKNRIGFLKDNNVHDASMIILDNTRMEILVMIGGISFFGETGNVNGVMVPRQAASTMKAFTYALAFDKKIITPASILPDIYTEFPSSIGKYIPRNYNGLFHGPVRAAVALGSSYNVPAVYLLTKIGLTPYYEFLKKAGFSSIDRPPSFYGLGLTLGNADITLLELTRAYAVFPNGGIFRQLRGIISVKTTGGDVYYPPVQKEARILSAESSFLIGRILSDFDYKVPGFGVNSPIHFPFPLAVKTGTSKDFRDNFIEAFDTDITVGIWTGNINGEPMRNMPSANGSGILLRDIAGYLYQTGHNFRQVSPSGLNITMARICPLSGKLANDQSDSLNEYFIKGTEPTEPCDWHKNGEVILPEIYKPWAKNNLNSSLTLNMDPVKIINPLDGDIFKIDDLITRGRQKIVFKARSVQSSVEWSVNGKPAGSGREVTWELKPGIYNITAESGSSSDSIKIIVIE